MTRHCVLALVVALLCTVTAVVLAEVGVFDKAGEWLVAQYAAESLLKGGGTVGSPWLDPVIAGLAALVVAWVAVDLVPWTTRTVVFTVAGLMTGFLSLTLALYGVTFNPLPSLLAATLAWLMGGLLAETPAGRRQREWQSVIGDRLAPTTLAEWVKADDAVALDGAVREAAVLAVRVLDPLPTAQKAAAHLAAMRLVVNEAAAFLNARGDVVLDVATGDGLRAFFGFGPKGASSGPDDAATAALALAGFLKEEATLAAQGGRPALTCGVGLSFGSLLCGNHGPDRSAFWTATGPPAEQARQLAVLNARHGTRILVGRRLAERLRERFDLRPIDGEAVQTLLAAKLDTPADDLVPDLPGTEPAETDRTATPTEPEPPTHDALPLSPPTTSEPTVPELPHEAKARRKRLKPGPSLD